MKSIGLFFGTFNPIHIGHLVLANYFAEHTEFEEIWLVVTPQNPFKTKQDILANDHRFEMVKRATEAYPKLHPCSVEFEMPTPNYTIDTLLELSKKYPRNKFSLIMGMDNLASFPKWKGYTRILDDYGLWVYPRKTHKMVPDFLKNHPQITVVAAPEIEIASSEIRKQIQNQKNIRPLLPAESWQYLIEMNFYR